MLGKPEAKQLVQEEDEAMLKANPDENHRIQDFTYLFQGLLINSTFHSTHL